MYNRSYLSSYSGHVRMDVDLWAMASHFLFVCLVFLFLVLLTAPFYFWCDCFDGWQRQPEKEDEEHICVKQWVEGIAFR